REPRAAVVGLREQERLHHRPHRAVEDDDAGGEKRAKGLGSLRARKRPRDAHARPCLADDTPARSPAGVAACAPVGGGDGRSGTALRSPATKRSAASTRPNGRLTCQPRTRWATAAAISTARSAPTARCESASGAAARRSRTRSGITTPGTSVAKN